MPLFDFDVNDGILDFFIQQKVFILLIQNLLKRMF